MKRAEWLCVMSTVLLSACVSPSGIESKIDYSKVDAECGRLCKKDYDECNVRFAEAELSVIRQVHCGPEVGACIKACPPPGTTVVTSPANLKTTTDKPPISDRLKQLEELHKSGVITDKEYADKRQEIIKSL